MGLRQAWHGPAARQGWPAIPRCRSPARCRWELSSAIKRPPSLPRARPAGRPQTLCRHFIIDAESGDKSFVVPKGPPRLEGNAYHHVTAGCRGVPGAMQCDKGIAVIVRRKESKGGNIECRRVIKGQPQGRRMAAEENIRDLAAADQIRASVGKFRLRMLADIGVGPAERNPPLEPASGNPAPDRPPCRRARSPRHRRRHCRAGGRCRRDCADRPQRYFGAPRQWKPAAASRAVPVLRQGCSGFPPSPENCASLDRKPGFWSSARAPAPAHRAA